MGSVGGHVFRKSIYRGVSSSLRTQTFRVHLLGIESSQARKFLKEHKPKLLSPDIFRWGGGLPREGGGGHKVRYAPTKPGKSNLLAGYLRILPGYPRGTRKV